MSVVGERTQYLNLEQIEAVCSRTDERLLVGNGELIEALRRELAAISANGLRSSALGQGLFGPAVPRAGLIALAGPGGVGKTFFAELLARVAYGEHFADHLVNVNCRAYSAGRFPALPRSKLEAGPLAIISLDGVEILPEIPPVAALWTDAIRYGRAALPVTGEQGAVTQQELPLGRCLIVATANVARELVAHVGFRPAEAAPVGSDVSTRMIRDALSNLFDGVAGEVFPTDRWIILPPLQRRDMRRLVDLQLVTLAELLPMGSPPIEITEPAATRLIETAISSRSPNKTVALVDLMRFTVGPVVDVALLRASAPTPLRVRVGIEQGKLNAIAEPASTPPAVLAMTTS